MRYNQGHSDWLFFSYIVVLAKLRQKDFFITLVLYNFRKIVSVRLRLTDLSLFYALILVGTKLLRHKGNRELMFLFVFCQYCSQQDVSYSVEAELV